MMPVMNGYQFCQQVKEQLPISHIPVVLLTAKSDSESQKIGYKLGADAYLSKPFDIDLLLSVINNLLKQRELIRQRYQLPQNRLYYSCFFISSFSFTKNTSSALLIVVIVGGR